MLLVSCNFLLLHIKGYYPSPLICCAHGISTVNKNAADIFKVRGSFSTFNVFSIKLIVIKYSTPNFLGTGLTI